ncbi:acyl-CoA thioesterase [Caldimonas aquatica]|uniref:Acyl-CoA thioesterase n=1 Tax=Caldimonas aquatica TaxID=376175 RepID=A0ABY6MR84_9BURK|nr:acyl-CoA thioesterase [Schlegelella aquatica]UZD54507.1 acyl-CoA thioesterase [Schlegelella aquatica]
MSDLVETYRGTVYPWHCDHMGHMNVMWYVGKFDEATWQLLTMLGLSPAWLRENRRGMVALDQRIATGRCSGRRPWRCPGMREGQGRTA